MKLYLLVIFIYVLFPVKLSAQNDQEYYIALRQTLPQYLNTNPNSLASYLKNGWALKLFYGLFKDADRYITDSLELSNIEAAIKQIELASDSAALILKENKITVEISDSLYSYNYKPLWYNDLRDSAEWENKRKWLEDEFQNNSLAILDTITAINFIPLIRKQILNDYVASSLDLNQLNDSYYIYKTECDSNCNEDLCFKGYRLYKPVFNEQFDKGCYLFSFYCGNGICKDFIFIEKHNDNWIYKSSYPENLIGNK